MLKHIWSSPSGLSPGELKELTRKEGVEVRGLLAGQRASAGIRRPMAGQGWEANELCVLFILNQSAHLTRLAQGLGGDIRCPKSQPGDKALPTRASA